MSKQDTDDLEPSKGQEPVRSPGPLDTTERDGPSQGKDDSPAREPALIPGMDSALLSPEKINQAFAGVRIDTERINHAFSGVRIDTERINQAFGGSVVPSDILPALKSVESRAFGVGELPTFRAFTDVSVLSGSVTMAVRGLDEAVRLVPKTLGLDEAVRLVPKTLEFDVNRLSTAGRADIGAVHSRRGTIGAVHSRRALTFPAEGESAFDEGLLGLIVPQPLLRNRLAALNPDLLVRLDGAWERVRRPGPDAASQAAHSLVEAIDWTLRMMAPENDVISWHGAERRPASELDENGRPTRMLKVLYILRDRSQESQAVQFYARSIKGLMDAIQSYKHGLDAASRNVEAVASLIPTVEGYLTFLLFPPPR